MEFVEGGEDSPSFLDVGSPIFEQAEQEHPMLCCKENDLLKAGSLLLILLEKSLLFKERRFKKLNFLNINLFRVF